MVMLKNRKKQKFQVLLFPSLKDSFRFAKALMCAKSWIIYQNYCVQNKLIPNLQWARILQQIVTHQHSLALIDPDLFIDGSDKQVSAFLILITNIPFAHSFQLRYSIVNNQSIHYTIDFLKNLEEKIHLITMSQTNIKSQNLIRIFTPNIKLKQLRKLNLSKNQLNDQCFIALQSLARQNKKLSYIDLSFNHISLSNFSHFLQFMKVTPIILNLNLSHNKITDKAVEHIQKFIIFALNPPLEEIDFSFNQFSLKGAWRLYVGFLKNFKNHVYLNFIIYPIPFKKQIFYENQIDFPKKQNEINFNMHSALVEQFQQQSMMRHTMQDIILKPQAVTIRFIRQLQTGVRLPKNKQQVSKTLQLSNKIQNFVYAVQSVEKIYQLANNMKNFAFQIPPRTRNNFVKFLNKKLNQALLIRDHYSIKYILKSMKQLQIPIQGYYQRLKRVQNRDVILCRRLENILEFKHNQNTLNNEIDEIVKENLRLYLQGKGVQLLYYLKFYRDQYIEKLLADKYNPEHQIYGKMAAKNLSSEEKVSAKDFIIPYEIKIEKKINQNFYLHPWQTNYLVLCQLNPKTFVECLQFLQESQKRQTFAKYFERIQERVEFIKNEFTLFTYKQFKISYTDLKVNACRLLFLYKNIQDTHFYLQIPIYIKKKPITCQKSLYINNPDSFVKKYHIVNYPNINYKAKKQMFYNYQDIITRYQSQTFENEAKNILNILNTIFKVMQEHIHNKKPKQTMINNIIGFLKQLIDKARHSIYPQQIKEQIYLHVIGWRKGRYGKNTEVIDIIPWLTMYLKPPLQIEKYLVAAILQSKSSDLEKYPLCLVSDMNRPTPQDIIRLDSQFVQRDWFHSDHVLTELIINNGKLYVQIHLLDKKKLGVMVPESMTISQLMSYVMNFHELNCQDRQCFWLYKLDKQLQQTLPLTGSDYVGQIISDMNIDTEILICRRRIYSREIKYVYFRYGEAIIDSLYSEVKFQYMMRGLFDSDKHVFEIASLLFIIDNIQNFQLIQKKNPLLKDMKIDQYILEQVSKIQSVFPSYIPRQIMARMMKSKDIIFSQIKAKVSQRMLKKQHNVIFEMKTKFLKYFENFPQFCSTNYKMMDKNSNDLKVYINCMYIYIESQTERQYIKLEKIISIIPKSKYILVCYHKNENIVGQMPLFSEQINIIGVAMDILTYCLMRVKMVSSNLYQINRYERIESQIQEIQKSLKRVYSKSMEQKLFQNRQQKVNIQGKIMKMSLTLMDLKQLIYYNQSKYIKSFLDRKLYANKSEKKMCFSQEMDEQEVKETQIWNKNVFKTIFPLFQSKFLSQEPRLINKGMQDDQYVQNSQYDMEYYPQNQKYSESYKQNSFRQASNDENQQYSPFKKTQKKAQMISSYKGDNLPKTYQQYQSTTKKINYTSANQNNPKIQQKEIKPYSEQPRAISHSSNIPNKQHYNSTQNKKLQYQEATNKKPFQKVGNKEENGQKPSPIQIPNSEQEAVYSNKKAGGRNIPPRRRQR